MRDLNIEILRYEDVQIDRLLIECATFMLCLKFSHNGISHWHFPSSISNKYTRHFSSSPQPKADCFCSISSIPLSIILQHWYCNSINNIQTHTHKYSRVFFCNKKKALHTIIFSFLQNTRYFNSIFHSVE